MNTEVLKMKPEYTGQRVDRQLSELMPELSRSYIQKLLKEGMVLANGKPVKALQIKWKRRIDSNHSRCSRTGY